MHEEIEIKVILKNPEEVESKLKRIAKFIKEKKQIDEYFVPKHKDFFKEKPIIKYLRVRHEDGKDVIGYYFCHLDDKGYLLKTDEYETKIENPKMMSVILKKLDMINKVTVKKYRKYFEYKNFEILIDNVDKLGCFLEIEAKKFFNSVEKTREKCFEVLKDLEAKWEKIPEKGYPDMIIKKDYKLEFLKGKPKNRRFLL